ncbi:Clavata3/ESR (CLE) gene family member [Medicago truncatula]|uniref:Clavata3/ESR (CLE) gene family member n=1 Tax=Medicago truncatula TaxID=3880 RepID=G7JHG6_MEDTR|nr:Clavata3/ESR (CLE) gene family member [Medicago truncatula]
MKTSHSSSFLLLLFFFFFLSSSANSRFLPSPSSSRNLHHCNSFSNRKPRSLCYNLQRIHHQNMHQVPHGVEIDPRYGVDKRLVPSGPNPLHN